MHDLQHGQNGGGGDGSGSAHDGEAQQSSKHEPDKALSVSKLMQNTEKRFGNCDCCAVGLPESARLFTVYHNFTIIIKNKTGVGVR
jgi:hypothetical protein